nr:immunoglobulin heavy chain junction region [Macaca mulatta]MOW88736.1 immunoglobulin heavy chain junction region [Macaca mulatta]
CAKEGTYYNFWSALLPDLW